MRNIKGERGKNCLIEHVCADAVLYPVEINRSFGTMAIHCRQIYASAI